MTISRQNGKSAEMTGWKYRLTGITGLRGVDRRHTFETALITVEPVSQSLVDEGFFTYFITAEQLFARASEP